MLDSPNFVISCSAEWRVFPHANTDLFKGNLAQCPVNLVNSLNHAE